MFLQYLKYFLANKLIRLNKPNVHCLTNVLFLIFAFIFNFISFAQYSVNYVESRTQIIQNESYSIVKMTRKDERVKVKYFAAKDFSGKSVYDRFIEWSKNKNIILFSSGTYMTDFDKNIALPEGICVDNGVIVNKTLQKYDGLAIIYATGGIAVSNIKLGDLNIISSTSHLKKTVNLQNAFDRAEFLTWAQDNEATVFQTHLFYFKNELLIHPNSSSPIKQERRFFAVGKLDGVTTYYIINLASSNTIYDATVKVAKFLHDFEDLQDITFILNLDTGSQNVFQLKTSTGQIDTRNGFQGTIPPNRALNLLVYYFD